MEKLAGGSKELAGGSKKLAGGSTKLAGGSKRLTEGASVGPIKRRWAQGPLRPRALPGLK